MVTPDMILERLPAYQDKWELIKKTQYVPDIVHEICTAHRLYAPLYDQFSYLFYSKNAADVADKLYDFCRTYIRYKEETVDFQTSAVPQGIVERGYGDCKHYALINAGVIGSLNRLYNCCFEAYFYFVGYRKASEPYHVYVSIVNGDEEIWIDPTPGSGGIPTLIIPKSV